SSLGLCHSSLALKGHMKRFPTKRWFLLVLFAGIGIASLCPHWLRPLTQRIDERIAVASALFLIAWSLESRNLISSLIRPLPALWAVAISYGFLPALAWSVSSLLPGPELRVGLLIAASVPCTLASAVLWTRLAGGNDATALLIVMLTMATSWLATTAWLT